MEKEYIGKTEIVYFRRTGAYGAENYELMERLKRWIAESGREERDGAIYAIAWDDPCVTPPEECRFDVCYPVRGFEDDGSGIAWGFLPEGAYAVYKIPHTAEAVQGFWASLGDKIMSDGLVFDGSRRIMERYRFTLVAEGYCEFCVPIEK